MTERELRLNQFIRKYRAGADAVDIAVEAFVIANNPVPQKWMDAKRAYDDGLKILSRPAMLTLGEEEYSNVIAIITRDAAEVTRNLL